MRNVFSLTTCTHTKLNHADKSGRTPLIYSAHKGSDKCVAVLLELGADWTVADKNGNTAADHAKAGGILKKDP